MIRTKFVAVPTALVALLLAVSVSVPESAQSASRIQLSKPLIPGTGLKIEEMGDDFEDANWKWYTNGPTPLGGPGGRKGSVLIRSLYRCVPGRFTRSCLQDDLIFGGGSRFGTFIDVKHQPSFLVHVYLPPWKYWDNITDSSLGIRCDVEGRPWKDLTRQLFTTRISDRTQTYWPGFFIQFNSPDDKRYNFTKPAALIIMRADERGEDVVGPEIKQPGWWTFGMSFTPDGRVHYYASPGVDPLTARDRIGSFFPYSNRTRKFNSFFFNVISRNDGKHWSTPWVIDSPYVHVARRSGIARK